MAVRRLSRLPGQSRHVVVLAISIGLATFAISGWAVAGHNRAVRGTFEVGAARVLNVETRPGVDLLRAVRRADPGPPEAMAVEVENGSDGQTLAVDAGRLAAVASWPPGLSARSITTIAAALARAPAPAVTLSGSALGVTVDLARAITPAPQLQATVFDNSYQVPTTIYFGPLSPGTHQYRASAQGSCDAGCRLVSLGLTWSPPSSSSAQSVVVPLTVRALTERSGATWRSVPAGLTSPQHWTTSAGTAALTPGPAGLGVRAIVEVYGGATTFGPDDVPTNLPAVVIGNASGASLGVGLDGSTINLAPVASVPSLPGIGSGASMVDLTLAQRLQAGPALDVTDQVWLAPGAPPDLVGRLAPLGVRVTGVRTAVEQERALARTGISLAYSFFVLAAVLAALLAVASTAFVLISDARRRLRELAALHAVGISPRLLRQAMRLEQLAVVGAGVVAGVVAGVLAGVVALPSIPEFIALGAGPPLDDAIPILPVAAVAVGVAVLLTLTVGLVARGVVGRTTSDQLGTAQ